jgi:hypothetical protein
MHDAAENALYVLSLGLPMKAPTVTDDMVTLWESLFLRAGLKPTELQAGVMRLLGKEATWPAPAHIIDAVKLNRLDAYHARADDDPQKQLPAPPLTEEEMRERRELAAELRAKFDQLGKRVRMPTATVKPDGAPTAAGIAETDRLREEAIRKLRESA